MKWTLAPLPYPKKALEPHLSATTLGYHYDKHHAGYLKKLHEEIGDTPLAKCSLEEIVVGSDGKVFNLAAQVWNHDFYWRSLSPEGGGSPPSELRATLDREFGSFEALRTHLIDAAVGEFGSGWAWLYRNRETGHLAIAATSNAHTPLAAGHTPVLTIDVWEHAYYLDFHHERERYAEAVVDHLLNWEFAGENVKRSEGR